MHLKHILRQVEPDRGNLRHDRSPPWILADRPWHIDAVGGRSHHVWVAPVLAGCRLNWHDTIECVHVSDLFSGRFAQWPVWDPQVGFKTSDRARGSTCDTDFSNPDLVDRFHTRFSFSRIFEAALPAPSDRRKRSPSKLFVPRDHGPQHARHFVRQRDGGQHPWFAGDDAPEPRAFRWGSRLGTGDHRHGADDQQAPDVPLPGLTCPAKPRLATARMLPGHKAPSQAEKSRPR